MLLVGPLLRWRRDRRPLLRRVAVPALIVAGALLISWLARAATSACCRASAWRSPPRLPSASLLPLFGRNLLRAPLAIWGMVIAHFGVAVALAGMATDSAFTQEKLAVARAGDTARASARGWSSSPSVEPVAGPNWTAIEADAAAPRAGEGADDRSSRRPASFTDPPTETNEAAIADRLERPALRRHRPARIPTAAGSCACGGSRS